MILTNKAVEECIETLKKYASVELTFSQMRDVLETDIEFQLTVSDWGCSDTAERESLMNLVSRYVGAGEWPTNGENRFSEFWEDFSAKAVEKGYRIITT